MNKPTTLFGPVVSGRGRDWEMVVRGIAAMNNPPIKENE